MNYISTRNKNYRVSSAVAIKTGLSEDGGLFVPCDIPHITKEDIDTLVHMDYIARAEFILSHYLTDFTEDEIKTCVEGAYGSGKFDSEDISPLTKLGRNKYLLELWHGPTCAFKDMALQILPYFLTVAMKKTGEEKTIVILVATSGDTGKAALEGFKDVDGTKIIVFYPNDGVSDIQKLQMITQEGGNVFVSAIDGNFDDAQNGVKQIFTDNDAKIRLLQNNYILSSANSINWGRLVPQIVYYISAYCDMIKSGDIKNGESINICVPTGNFGNILAAYYAKQMGLPVNKLICASNQNSVLTDFINTGMYDKNRSFYTTISPSMDILISSNLERLLFEISNKSDTMIKSWMDELKTNGKYRIDDASFEKIQSLLWAGHCDDNATKEQIAKTFEKYGYTLDTHTAVAVNVYEQYAEQTGDSTKTVIASTASPFKFGDSVLSAFGIQTSGMNDDEILKKLSETSKMPVPQPLTNIQGKVKRFTNTADKENLLSVIEDFLNM